MIRFTPVVACAALGGCMLLPDRPDPVGRWEGVIELEDVEGDEYVNEMSVEEDGTATLTLYAIVEVYDEEEDELVERIAESEFEAVWESGREGVAFALDCHWIDCYYSPIMDCVASEEELACDLIPDLYEDDEEVLQWLRVD